MNVLFNDLSHFRTVLVGVGVGVDGRRTKTKSSVCCSFVCLLWERSFVMANSPKITGFSSHSWSRTEHMRTTKEAFKELRKMELFSCLEGAGVTRI